MFPWVYLLGIVFVVFFILPILILRIKEVHESLESLSNMDNYHEPGIWDRIIDDISEITNEPPE